MHVPKCAGTSLTTALFKDRVRFVDLITNRIAVLDAAGSVKKAEKSSLPLHLYRAQALEKLLEARKTLVCGHFGCSQDLVARYRHSHLFITVIREPVRRWISHYFYDRYRRRKLFYDPWQINQPLEEFVETHRAHSAGRMYVAAFAAQPTKHHIGDDELAKRAVATLEQFDLVGRLENIDAFLDGYGDLTGSTLKFPRQNINPVAEQHMLEQIAPNTMSKIEQLCQPDIAVYDAMKKRLS